MRIAATHTQARYTLPYVVLAFKEAHPEVELHLHQGSAQQVADLVRHREVDIGIGTDTLAQCPELLTLPCQHWTHTIIVLQGHPLADGRPLTLGPVNATEAPRRPRLVSQRRCRRQR
jgi:DNA-binding transcriptional LysR family regulator